MRISTLSDKSPVEVVPVTVDFKNLVDSIDTAALTISVKAGVDASPAALLMGSAQITGTQVRQLIQGGVDDVVYLIRFDISSGSEVYSEAVYLPVQELV